MLFWLFIVLFIIFLVLGIIDNWYNAAIYVITWTLCILNIVNIGILAVQYISADAYVSAMTERYESLTYQYENDIYNNDNDVGKRELMEDIQNWNEDLASFRSVQNDFWVGIFVPDVYDQFEFIELDVKETEG